MHIQNDN